MNLTIIDWSIVFVILALMIVSVVASKRLMKSVADFLVAGRSAGRYVISISSGVAGLGAITIINYMEMNYIAGFSMSWWGMTSALVILFITVSGWVIYRFRQTRCLTLAQFFEMRYSRSFRIFTGMIAFIAGLINFGIFPAVGARFFIHFCGLPQTVALPGFEIGTYPLLMIILLSISLYFVFTGGQIAVIIADFFQGAFINIVFVIIILFLFFSVNWGQVQDALVEAPKKLANTEIQEFSKSDEYLQMTETDKDNRNNEIQNKWDNSSRINPFRTSHVDDFNFWFFLIGVIGVMYGTMSWQGTQAYNASAKSAHEAKMGSVLAGWRGLPQTLFFLFVPIIAYTIMNHADYSAISGAVNGIISNTESETLQSQIRVPLVLSKILPVGLMGAFAAVMLAAFISTHDTYLHSWGSIIVQDVILPFRKKPFSPKKHLLLLRLSIVAVAIFIFFFSLLFQQTQKIALFFAITGAIFAGGSGAVIIGGLYWKRGTAAAAWSAMTLGAAIAVGGIIMHQIPDEMLAMNPNAGGLGELVKPVVLTLKSINGQLYWGIGMGAASLTYVIVSLLSRKKPFDMDQLLKRGKYINKEETKIIKEQPVRGWRILGMGKEFTKFDKFIYIINYIWTFGWTIVFIIGTIYNLSHEVSDSGWMQFWKIYLIIHITLAVFSIIWFTIGGMIDLKVMIKKLRTAIRDEKDDGFIGMSK
jgi:solute:Na+ symporter, SSS family